VWTLLAWVLCTKMQRTSRDSIIEDISITVKSIEYWINLYSE
jgi:hypothetical protein